MTTMFELQALPILGQDELRFDLPCFDADPELFFADAPGEIEVAKALCVPCPLREQCLQGALERREPHGVWGGQLFIGGVVVARKRPRGRPRKIRPEEEQVPLKLPVKQVEAA